MKRLVFLTPLLVFVFIALYFAAGLTRDPSSIPSALINKPVPQFDLEPINTEREGFSADDIDGEIALVNVFASWCIPCLIEHPTLMKLKNRNDFVLAGVNWKEKPGAGAAWLERHGDPYEFVGDDRDGRIAIEFGVTGAPETFIIDRKGRIRFRYVGPITDDIWTYDIEPIVNRLLGEKG